MAKSLQEMRERVCEANKSLPVHSCHRLRGKYSGGGFESII